MKFLFLTVALVHCAFAASDGNGSRQESGVPRELFVPAEDQSRDTTRIGHYMITGGDKEESEVRVYKYAPLEQKSNFGGGLDDDDQDETNDVTFTSSEKENPIKFRFSCRDPINGNNMIHGYCSECKSTEKPNDGKCDQCDAQGQWTRSSADDTNRQVVSSEYIKTILGNDKTANKVPLTQVEGPALREIFDYLAYHNGMTVAKIAKPIRSQEMTKIVEDDWDAQFINKQSKKMIFQIILGANYLVIESLLHLGCAKIATLIKGKSPEEIKKILGDDGTCDPAGGNGTVFCPKCKETRNDHRDDPDFVLPAGCPECAKMQIKRRRLLGDAFAAFAKADC